MKTSIFLIKINKALSNDQITHAYEVIERDFYGVKTTKYLSISQLDSLYGLKLRMRTSENHAVRYYGDWKFQMISSAEYEVLNTQYQSEVLAA